MSLVKKRNYDVPVGNLMLPDLLNADRFFNRWFDGETLPATNISETDTSYEVELAVPGLKKEDFNIEIDGGRLRVYAEKKSEKEESDKNYTRQEFSYSSFNRMF